MNGRMTCAALSVLLLGLLATAARGAEKSAPVLMEPAALAVRIDELIGARLAKEGVESARTCDDATFIRRVYLDLSGCIPPSGDLRDFLDDTRADKRRLWVEEILTDRKPTDRPGTYARHFAARWRSWLLSRQPIEAQVQSKDLEDWLRGKLAANVGFDRLAREVLSQPGFTRAYQGPEALTGATARLFLGVKLECAQCHDDRSGGSWVHEEFWSYAAFFAPGPQPTSPDDEGPTIKISGKSKLVPARFLGGGKPVWKPGTSVAATFAEWMTGTDNPFFAKATVNRMWAYLLGTGLIEPIDGWNKDNPASNPELLDLMAQQFAAHNFDLKYLIRAIIASRTYQASSSVEVDKKDMNPQLFARAAVRGLSAEQIFDSLAEATEFNDPRTGELTRGGQATRNEFVIRFSGPERPVDAVTSVPDALFFMNSPFAMGRASLSENRALRTIADAEGMSTARRVESLYMLVLSRRPRSEERDRLVKFVDRGGPTGNSKQALADVCWALLNSAEFRTNH
jgi:hypothetical protein